MLHSRGEVCATFDRLSAERSIYIGAARIHARKSTRCVAQRGPPLTHKPVERNETKKISY